MSDYDVKFGYATGYSLVFTAFQPDGTGRGTANQPLYEVRPTGYYRAEPSTAFQDGDIILVYNNEIVYWEDEPVFYLLIYDYVFYENEQVYWESEPVYDYDEGISDTITWVGDTLGSGEYTIGEGGFSTILENINLLIVAEQRMDTVIDESTKAETVVVLKGL